MAECNVPCSTGDNFLSHFFQLVEKICVIPKNTQIYILCLYLFFQGIFGSMFGKVSGKRVSQKMKVGFMQ